MSETIFGHTLQLCSGRIIPTRWVGEQHVREDLGFIPSFADWVKAIRPEPWMGPCTETRRLESAGARRREWSCPCLSNSRRRLKSPHLWVKYAAQPLQVVSWPPPMEQAQEERATPISVTFLPASL
jgi:hypothetical protein